MNRINEKEVFEEFTEQTPLEPGVVMLEASAGTGKTYQITSIFLRLLGEEGIEMDKILAMTFTVAATAEMKERLRKRLQEALIVAQRKLWGNIFENEKEDDPLVRSMLKRVDAEVLIDRFSRALTQFDYAQVFTIHGFCLRMLQSFAFEVGLEFGAELVEDASELVREALTEFYVQKMEKLSSKEQWVAKEATKEKLFDKLLEPLLRLSDDPDAVLLPEKPELSDPPEIEIWEEAFAKARNTWEECADEIVGVLKGAIADKALNRRYYKNLYEMAQSVSRYLSRPRNPCDGCEDDVRYLTSERLRENTNKGHVTPSHEFFGTIARVIDIGSRFKEWYQGWKIVLMHEAFSNTKDEIKKKKREKKVMTYHDLLVLLRDAILDKDRGEMVRHAIQSRYRAVLVDEFQDTDVVQWEIFRTLFANCEDRTKRYLFLVGDPKQSIYAFRKADVFAYLEAQKEAQRRYTISVNWRSDEALVSAINQLFLGHPNPFKHERITYHKVEVADKNKEVRVHDMPECARYPLTFRVKKAQEEEKNTNKDELEGFVLRTVAGDIVDVLNSRGKIKENHEWRRILPRDIAVLVRTNDQARKVKGALARRGVPAVIFGDESVFLSDCARFLSFLLRAVLNPSEMSFVKTALATPLFAMTPEDVLKLDEERMAEFSSLMNRLREIWVGQGVAPMVSHALGYSNNLAHILEDENGERLATDLRHLTELLQERENAFQAGVDGLFSWFVRKIAMAKEGKTQGEEEQVRLESDADAVNVVTMHKAKGLEYGIVFCPFLWEGVKLHSDEKISRFHEPVDDKKLAVKFAALDFAEKSKKEELKEKARAEQFQESIRIAYVALTRAKHRCIVYGMWHKKGDGTAQSPLWWILRGENDPEGVQPTDDEFRSAIEGLAHSSSETIGISEIVEEGKILERYRLEGLRNPDLSCLKFSRRSFVPFVRTSFSGLVEVGKRYDEPTDVEAKTIPELPSDSSAEILLPTFPEGAIAGQCIHEIFSKISFRDFPNNGQTKIVLDALKRFGFKDSHKDGVQKMLEVVLRYPIEPKIGLALERIEDNERFCEIGFVVPAFRGNDGHISLKALGETLMKEGSDMEKEYAKRHLGRLDFSDFQGLVVGQMDLVFRYKGKWYLVDYKTNKLGVTLTDYGQKKLLEVMIHDHYVLQYLLYYTALHRYLRYRLKGYDPERDIGSIYYLFVRGMKEGGGDTGVFSTKPPVGLLEGLSDLFGTSD
jgi:exodeoxyribonuclease V beta subunit